MTAMLPAPRRGFTEPYTLHGGPVPEDYREQIDDNREWQEELARVGAAGLVLPVVHWARAFVAERMVAEVYDTLLRGQPFPPDAAAQPDHILAEVGRAHFGFRVDSTVLADRCNAHRARGMDLIPAQIEAVTDQVMYESDLRRAARMSGADRLADLRARAQAKRKRGGR